MAKRQGHTEAHSKGFTLIEVIVAMAVVSIALAALVSSAGHSARQARLLIDRMQARWVADNVLTQLQLERYWDAVGAQRNGDMEMGGRTWYWRSELLELQDERLRRVDAQVRYQSSDPLPIYTVSGFLLQGDS